MKENKITTDLTDEQITALIKRSRDETLSQEERLAARNKVIEAKLPLVLKIAHNYKTRGADTEDIADYGNFGLFNAVSSFDTSSETKFNTYAISCINREIAHSLLADKMVRIPTSLTKSMYKVKKDKTQKWSPKLAQTQALLQVKSLDEKISAEGDATQIDTIVDEKNPTPEDAFFGKITFNKMYEAFKELPLNQQAVLNALYFSNPHKVVSMAQAGRLLNISAQRVSTLRNKALINLFHNRKLNGYF